MKNRIIEITQFMRENTERPLTIEELSKQFGYSKFHFSREFKKELGVTPNEYWAALKMERSLTELEKSSSILNAHLKTGYQSTGTFTSSFQKATGFTPKQYQEEIQKLSMFQEAKQFEQNESKPYTYYSFDKKDSATNQPFHLFINCHMPENFKGLIFVGLFPKPLPVDTPIVGKAMTKTTQCVIDQIPQGEYYVLACAIRSNTNPLTYFQPNCWLRDLHRNPYRFPLEHDVHIDLTLREKISTDPAIPLNPMKLLVDVIRSGQ